MNMYSEKDMELAFETGRNFQVTGDDNLKELLQHLKNVKVVKSEGQIAKDHIINSVEGHLMLALENCACMGREGLHQSENMDTSYVQRMHAMIIKIIKSTPL